MTRAPVKLSREMKVLLGLLLLVAAIGVYYLLTKPGAEDLASQPPPPVVAGGPGDDTIPVTPAEPDPAAGETPGVAVQPDAEVEVEVIPPFPTENTVTDPASPAPGDVPPTPAGINPEATLASVPSNNPFQPLQVTEDDSAPAGQTPAPTPGTPGTTASVPEPITPAVDPLGSTGGPLAISPLPGANGADSSDGGAVPVPVIPGGDGSTGPVAQPVVVTPIPAGTPVVVSPGTPAQPVPAPQPAPVKPPVAGVSVPGVTSIPALTAGPAGGSTNGGATTGTSGVAPATAAPAPGTPQVITDLGSGNASVPALNALDAFVQTQELAFNAVVLGPVNTAIFRSKDGFVVVSVGQTLPDTQVTVKEVTATGATLSLGNNSRTLELDKR